jgi:aspartyl aminopeptidase
MLYILANGKVSEQPVIVDSNVVALAVIGRKSPMEGVNAVDAHIDSPRIQIFYGWKE